MSGLLQKNLNVGCQMLQTGMSCTFMLNCLVVFAWWKWMSARFG